MKSRMPESGTFGSVRGGLSISHGTNIVTLPLRKREETGNTKLFLKLRVIHLLDSHNNLVTFFEKNINILCGWIRLYILLYADNPK